MNFYCSVVVNIGFVKSITFLIIFEDEILFTSGFFIEAALFVFVLFDTTQVCIYNKAEIGIMYTYYICRIICQKLLLCKRYILYTSTNILRYEYI